MSAKNRRRRKKTVYWILGICLFVGTGTALFVNIFSSGYLRTQLQEYVDAATNRKYMLSVSDLHFNFITRKLSIDSVGLENRSSRVLVFTATRISAGGISPWSLITGRKLKIKRLLVQDPLLEVHGPDKQNNELINKEELSKKVLPFFRKYLKNLTIRNIELVHAKISRFNLPGSSSQVSTVDSFDIAVANFYIDSVTLQQQDELFKADEIFFKIKNFNRMMSDSLHRIHLDELTYSIKNKKIKGRNIRLFPVDTTINNRTCYWVKVPEAELESDDLRGFPGSDTLIIKSLNLHQTEIRIRPPRSTREINFRRIREFDLYQLFKNDFQLIRIRHLSMEGKKMHIDSRTKDVNAYQEFRQIDVNIEGFRLDSMAYIRPDKVLYSDRFDLSIGFYFLKFNDQVHQFTAENIYASSADSLIQAGQIKLYPYNHRPKLPATVNLTCDSIRFLAVDFARLFHHREMPLKEVSAFKPVVTINKYSKATGKNKADESLLYRFIGNYIKGIYAQVVAIENGHFEINDFQNKEDPGDIKAGFNFRLTDFSLDSVTAQRTEKLFYATNIDLNFSNYSMKLADQLHRLEVNQINVSSLQRLVTLKDLHLFPDSSADVQETMDRLKRTELYDIHIPLLSLYNANINYAFFRKELNIKNISIIHPDIYVEIFANKKKKEKESNLDEFYELLNNYITQIDIGQIDAPNGELRLVNHSKKGKTIDLTNKFSLRLEHFVLNDGELTKRRLLFSDSFDLKLKDHLFKLSDHVHFLKAKEISLSSRNSSISISGALLYPDVTSPEYKTLPWHLQIGIPKVRLDQVDLEQAYFDQVLRVGTFTVESPVIEIYRNGKNSGKVNFRDISVPLPEEIKELVVGKVSLNNGHLKIYNMDQMQQKLVAGAIIGFNIEQARLKRPENTPTAKFSSKSMDANLSDLYLTPENIPYQVSIQKIDFSSEKGLLALNGLDIRLTRPEEKKAIARIQMPVLRFDGLDAVDAFQNNRFRAGQIRVIKPLFTINSTADKMKSNPLFIRLPHDILSVMDVLSAEKVTIEDAGIIIKKDSLTKEHQHINMTLDKFRLDSSLSVNPFGSRKLFIFRDNNHFSDNNKYYDLSVDRISFSSDNNQLSFSGIKIDPRYSRSAYQKVVPYQTDYYSGNIASINFAGIDPERWFSKHELAGNSILVQDAKIDIYRDKRTPFNEMQRRSLPQKLIRDFHLPFFFDSAKVVNASVSYSEQLENMPGPGIVWFDRLNCTLSPLTNLPDFLTDHPNIVLSASASLMDSSMLNVKMDFDMNSPSCQFTARGSLTPFDMTALNPMTENNAQIMVRSGYLNRFDFHFRADSVNSEGELMFAYDDLRISILEQKNGDTKEAKFLSFLANSLVLKSKNPRSKVFLPDEIYFKRDPKRSIINYWWKTVFSGAKNTFGIKDKEE